MLRLSNLPLAALVVCQTAAAFAQEGAIQWQNDLDAARAMAERENKLLLVHFYTKSCGPCRVLDDTVFSQPNVAATLHSHFVPVKLNAEEFQATAERFGISRVPSDVVITPEGRLLERMVSPATPMAYIGRMTGIATQYARQAGRDFQTATANKMSQPVNSAYAALAVPPGDTNSFTAPPAAPAPSNFTHNPYTGNPGTAAPQYTATATPTPPANNPNPVAVPNPHAGQPATPAMTTADTQTPDRYQTATVVTPSAEEKPAPPVAATEPQLPPNSPPLGFFGYCPVTMKEESRWQRGDTRWGCYHRGRTYLFASAENRDKFLADGDAYAPALSGIDPVLAIDSGQIEPGKQQFGIEFEGRFYLFTSEENLRKFWDQAPHYAAGVRQAMNAQAQAPSYR